MNLTTPITAITTPTTAKVLTVLAGTTMPLSGREIARIGGANTDPAGVWRSLAKLEQHGLVVADHRSQLTHYMANRDHLAWAAIESLIRLKSTLYERLAEAISGWKIQPTHASVFGSTARDEADPESDIDLLLVHAEFRGRKQPDEWAEQLDQLRSDVRRWTGNSCQTFDVGRERLREYVTARDPLVRNWLIDSKLLFGRPLRDLVQAA